MIAEMAENGKTRNDGKVISIRPAAPASHARAGSATSKTKAAYNSTVAVYPDDTIASLPH